MFPTETSFESKVSLETQAVPIPEEPPFRLLLLGDYSGRENLSNLTGATLPESIPLEIDRDNYEDLMGKLNVGLRLNLQEGAGDTLVLNFRELDDFHPDRIFQQISLFSDLRDVRQRLLDPDTFRSAAAEVRSWFDEVSDESTDKTADSDASSDEDPFEATGNLLDDILGQVGSESPARKPQTNTSPALSDFISDLVEPHIIRTDEGEQEKLLAVVDESTSELMRKILHHRDFQELEASWRGLSLLVRRIETGTDLKISILDISQNELSDSLRSSENLSDINLYKIFVEAAVNTPGGEPWTAMCGNYEFSLNVDDTATLMRLGKLGGAANAPFLSQIKPQMFGIESLAEVPETSKWNYSDDSIEGKLWTTLRTISEAPFIGLTTPRFLGRLPYGEDTEPTEIFSFEEFTSDNTGDNYLWTNSSFICALLLSQSYSAFGWEMGRSLFQEVEGLPIHMYKVDGELKTKPCAEIEMTHTACDLLLEQGLMPLISFRNTDRVRLGGFQSIAFPAKDLSGRWN